MSKERNVSIQRAEGSIDASFSSVEVVEEEAANVTEQVPTVTSPFFTLGEAAVYARCCTRQVQRWRDQGKLTRYGHGRKPLILKEELHALLTGSR